MGGDQASRTLLSIQLKNRGEEVSEEEKTQRLDEIQARYAAAMNPRYAAARLWVDAIIDPAETRRARPLAGVRGDEPADRGVQDGGAADVGVYPVSHRLKIIWISSRWLVSSRIRSSNSTARP